MTDTMLEQISEIIHDICDDATAIQCDISADAILDAQPGMVPDLIWDGSGHQYRTEALLFCSIRVEKYGAGDWKVFWSVPGYCDTLVAGSFDTKEAAKAAANTHHRAQIARALGIAQEGKA